MDLFAKDYIIGQFIFIKVRIEGKMILQSFADHRYASGDSDGIIFFIKMQQHIRNRCLPVFFTCLLVDAGVTGGVGAAASGSLVTLIDPPAVSPRVPA